MNPSNTHLQNVAQALRRALLLQEATGLLTARRRRLADRVRARPRLEGLEDRCLLSVSSTEYPTPTGNPYGITAGPDGNLWFTDGGDGHAQDIGMLNPTTDAITEFPVPNGSDFAHDITAGPGGNLWFTLTVSGQIGMINPTTGAISEFTVPSASAGFSVMGIAAGPDGNIWFTENNGNAVSKIGMINPTTDAITEFPIVTQSWADEICAGPDGNMWFTDLAGDIGMINPSTHAITEFPLGVSPYCITSGPDGNIWFTEEFANNIGMINPSTHAITTFAVPTAKADPTRITSGPDGNIWFAEGGAGQIGTISVATHAVTEYPIPYGNAHPMGITAGPDGNIWYTDTTDVSIGVATVNQTPITQLVVTQQPPSSVTAGSGFGLTVQAEDSSGNLITSFDGTVTVGLASNTLGTSLGGTVTVAASSGVATFSGLTLTKAASGYTLYVSGSGPIPTTTSAINVSPAAATQLVITQQPPSSVQVSTPFSMQASIEDAYGNVVTTAAGTVSVTFASNPTGATLGGTTSVTASGGVARFTNLTINKTGSGYTLRVSSTGLTSATSHPIQVTRSGAAPSQLDSATSANATDLSLGALVLDNPDVWDGLRFKKRPRSIG